MTIYFIIPNTQETAFKAAYLAQAVRKAGDNPNEDEKAAMMPEGGVGTRMITGSSRITQADADALALSNAPWLTIADTWPADWDYGVP